MEQQHTKRLRRTSEQAKILLEEFTRSNLSATEFCVVHAISEAAFFKWRSRYGANSAENKNNFVLLKQSAVALPQSALFAEVKGISIYQLVPASYLKELLV